MRWIKQVNVRTKTSTHLRFLENKIGTEKQSRLNCAPIPVTSLSKQTREWDRNSTLWTGLGVYFVGMICFQHVINRNETMNLGFIIPEHKQDCQLIVIISKDVCLLEITLPGGRDFHVRRETAKMRVWKCWTIDTKFGKRIVFVTSFLEKRKLQFKNVTPIPLGYPKRIKRSEWPIVWLEHYGHRATHRGRHPKLDPTIDYVIVDFFSYKQLDSIFVSSISLSSWTNSMKYMPTNG